MPRRNEQRKHGTTHRSPRQECTAKASRISRPAVKSRCAYEWGGWGRLSVDGLGQHSPVRSEDPWGRAVQTAVMALKRTNCPDTARGYKGLKAGSTKEGCKPDGRGNWAPYAG